MPAALIAIDQGTTSTRAIAFDAALQPLASAQQELRQIYPAPGEVEHDPEEIWTATVATVREAIAKAGLAAKDIAGIGITNQRETTVIWDRATGKPIHNAIVWQDRRTADFCDALRRAGHEPEIAAKTGLLLDPYFSASKIAWLLDHVDGARALARSRPARLRHHRLLLAVAAHRRQGARDRRHAMPRARCCSISGAGNGTTGCAGCSACRHPCCRRCATARANSASPRSNCSARPSAFSAWPATSRRRRSGRAASSPA